MSEIKTDPIINFIVWHPKIKGIATEQGTAYSFKDVQELISQYISQFGSTEKNNEEFIEFIKDWQWKPNDNVWYCPLKPGMTREDSIKTTEELLEIFKRQHNRIYVYSFQLEEGGWFTKEERELLYLIELTFK